MARVLILGGGFGGLAAAHELGALLPDDEIVLVSDRDTFYMGFAKLWDLAGVRPLAEGTVALSHLESRGVQFHHAEITGLYPQSRRVQTSKGELSGDALLVALGAGPSPAHRRLLAGDAAFDLYDGDQLPGIHRALGQIESGTVLVSILGAPFKCPPAPFEAALIVDESLRRRGVRDAVEVAISTPAPMTLPVAGPDASQYLALQLGDRNIQLLTEHKVVGVEPDRRAVQFAGGGELGFGVLLGVPANVVPEVLGACGMAGPSGWIEPDPLSLATSFERVYAVGDCTSIPAGPGMLPKAGVFAASQGRVAARNIAADLGAGERTEFDGKGFCFLELPGRKVAYVEGDWYATPKPRVHLSEADAEQFRRKQEYERARLAEWLGDPAR